MISVEALELLLKVDSAVEHHDIGLMGEARYLDAKENLQDYIASLESKLAARNALVERLVEAGQELADELPYGANEEIVNRFDALCDEYQASKDGGGE